MNSPKERKLTSKQLFELITVNTYRKILGVTTFIATLFFTVAFIYSISQSSLGDNSILIFVMALAAIGLYAFIQYIVMTRLGFYKEQKESKSWTPFMKFIPIIILLVMLFSIGFEYRLDLQRLNRPKDGIVKSETPVVTDYETRHLIMSDSLMSLDSKLKKLNLGSEKENTNFSLRYLISENKGSDYDSDTTFSKSLHDYYDKFSFKMSKNYSDSLATNNIELINGRAHLYLFNGREISEQVNDNHKLLGFLEPQNIFVFEIKKASNSYEYLCINGVNGTRIESVPMFNSDSHVEYYADVHFANSNQGVNLEIRFWYRHSDSDYDLIHKETIPMDFYFQTSKGFFCEIDNVYWTPEKKFKFEINAAKNQLKETAQVEVSITENW